MNNIIGIDDSLLFIMSATGDIICLKVGEETISNNIIDKDEVKTNNLKKHRLFDKDNDDLLKEEDLDEKESKPSRNKKHRVFDKNKKEKGLLDWLF